MYGANCMLYNCFLNVRVLFFDVTFSSSMIHIQIRNLMCPFDAHKHSISLVLSVPPTTPDTHTHTHTHTCWDMSFNQF